MTIWSGFFVVLLVSQTASGSPVTPSNLPQPQIGSRYIPSTVTADLEKKIVDFFTEGQCEKALSVVSPSEYLRLSAIPLAVVAYCEPKNGQSESYFVRAEELEPNKDTVYALHARYRWMKDPASAQELWKKVLFLARTKATRQMAKDYLSGFANKSEAVEVGQRVTWFSKFQLGASDETNPGSLPYGAEAGGSAAVNFQLSGGATKTAPFGSISANFSLLNNRYFILHADDLMEQDLEVPIALNASRNADIVFRPFGSYLTLGNTGFQVLGGLGIMGVYFHEIYKQSVQGIVYDDHYYVPGLKSQQGAHYRFEYDWQFFPTAYQLRTLFYFEHVSADQDSNSVTGAFIPYSHNNIGLHLFFDYDYKSVILSFYPKIVVREDSNPAEFISSDLGFTGRQRQDLQFGVQPNVTFRVASNFQILAWYEWSRTFSNIGPADYQDHNVLNQTVGVALKSFVASY